MALNMEDYVCEYCGKPCKNIVYAAFVCDDPECLEKARMGGPIIPRDLEEVADELNGRQND